jgi:carbon-monoxide dehydrogenase large subunit
VPATTNPLGVKGVGEAGTTASIAAVMNAVADALPGGAGARLDMPVTAMKLWEACRQAEKSASAKHKRSDRNRRGRSSERLSQKN